MASTPTNERSVLEIIDTFAHIIDWTPRLVARKLVVQYSPKNQRQIKRVLQALWLKGLIQRKTQAPGELVPVYCANSTILAESLVPCSHCVAPVMQKNGVKLPCSACSATGTD